MVTLDHLLRSQALSPVEFSHKHGTTSLFSRKSGKQGGRGEDQGHSSSAETHVLKEAS